MKWNEHKNAYFILYLINLFFVIYYLLNDSSAYPPCSQPEVGESFGGGDAGYAAVS